ncbi:rhodanese-like domain-containing protein [Salinicola tamaricis]|uniref:rhodanese-like domain-containing protein n=1 Tax=Salinicola tamaricis TaxID=1771309 RepID=UPI001A911A7C|nr:rhodanese-like domain-containing protein [Salinicola tamaricis]
MRTAEEYHDDGHPEAVHAPGGQLIQATDHWVGVYRARIVLLDDDACRAPMVAAWLALMGHEVAWLEGGRRGWGEIAVAAGRGVAEVPPDVPTLEVAAALDSTQLLDLQPGMAYRQAHLPVPAGSIVRCWRPSSPISTPVHTPCWWVMPAPWSACCRI